MTDKTDGRAERAFRHALSAHADTLQPVPLEIATRRRRSRWLQVGAAAAVLALVGGLSAVATLGGEGPTGPSDADSQAPAPDDGLRPASFHGVQVMVPHSWADAVEPGSDWCANGSSGPFPTSPYVAIETGGIARLIACRDDGGAPPEFGGVPPRLWVPHVSLEPAEGAVADGSYAFEGWTLDAATVDGVQVQVLSDDSTLAVGEQILASAEAVETDANGCDSASPVQAVEFVRPPAFDVTAVDRIDSLSVCLYPRSGTDAPGLWGSRRVTGDEAERILTAIKATPPGGGPDKPEYCAPDYFGDTGLVVRLHDGERTDDLYVYFDWCFGNGFDDGTERRQLTRDACVPLFAERVQTFSGSAPGFNRCHE